MVTATIVANRCEHYRKWAELWYDEYPIDPDIILAVAAKESGCDPDATDGQSMGLMQVTPRPWTLREEYLFNPKWNIYQGMQILYYALHNEAENPEGSLTRALAGYNCGWDSLNAGKCIPGGGYDYAMEVMLFWLPVVRGDLRTWEPGVSTGVGAVRRSYPQAPYH